MKVLGLMCSHRKNKNTEHALKYFLNGFGEGNEIVVKRLIDMDLNMCIACDFCKRNYGQCVHKDDMAVLVDSMLQCDLLVIATPLYFNSVTTVLKTMIDRTQVLYNAWYNFKDPLFKSTKPVVIIAVGGSKAYKTQFQGITVEMQHFLTNINGEVLDFIRYNNTDHDSIIENEVISGELYKKGSEIEAIVEGESYKD